MAVAVHQCQSHYAVARAKFLIPMLHGSAGNMGWGNRGQGIERCGHYFVALALVSMIGLFFTLWPVLQTLIRRQHAADMYSMQLLYS